MLIDSHCHIPLIKDEEAGATGVVERAVAAGVSHMLCVGVDLESFEGVRNVAKQFENVYASVGVHPNTEQSAQEPSIDDLLTRADDPDVVAIGETGLDYFRSDGNLDWQRARFRTHIRAAHAAQKPLIIHCREAADDLLSIMLEENAGTVGGVMHCFVESWEVAEAALAMGFYISLSGIVTFKNATALKDVARKVPLDRLLVETDSPWLSPVPLRGKQNEPANVIHTAHHIAELRGAHIDDIARATTENFFSLFSNAA